MLNTFSDVFKQVADPFMNEELKNFLKSCSLILIFKLVFVPPSNSHPRASCYQTTAANRANACFLWDMCSSVTADLFNLLLLIQQYILPTQTAGPITLFLGSWLTCSSFTTLWQSAALTTLIEHKQHHLMLFILYITIHRQSTEWPKFSFIQSLQYVSEQLQLHTKTHTQKVSSWHSNIKWGPKVWDHICPFLKFKRGNKQKVLEFFNI